MVGGIPTPLKKYEFVSWDDEVPKIWKSKCSTGNTWETWEKKQIDDSPLQNLVGEK